MIMLVISELLRLAEETVSIDSVWALVEVPSPSGSLVRILVSKVVEANEDET